MSNLEELAYLVGRQVSAVANGSATTTTTLDGATSIPACVPDNDFDGRIGLRVSAIFVILIGSLFGMCRQDPRLGTPMTETDCQLQVRYFQSTPTDIKVSEYRNGRFS